MFYRFIVLLFITRLLAVPIFAQTLDAQKMDSLFRELDNNNESMGSVSLFKNGERIYEKSIGYRSITDKEKLPNNSATRYRAASITKMFTATLIFQLIDEGKLSLDTTINTWFPDIPNANSITVRQLLCHRSGLRNFITTDTWILGHKSKEELLAFIAKSLPEFSPGSKAEYSNTNYWLLGYIAEYIGKKSYSELLQENICEPLHLKDTYYGDTTDISKNESHSYFLSDGKWMQYPETDMSILCGAGAIVATPADLCRFMTGLFAGKLISQQSLELMALSAEPEGMGMNKVPFYTHNGYGHTGHIDGFFSVACYFPADSLAVTYCSNGYHYNLNDILIGILSIYYGTPYAIPDFKAIAANAGNLAKYTGVYSCRQFPLKITVTEVATSLRAQATGQQSFPLTFVSTNKFRYAGADIDMEFHTGENEMVFKQHGLTYVFTKEEK